MIQSTDQKTPPVDLLAIARQRGVTEVVRSQGGPEGVLVPTKSGFRIELGKGLSRARERSTLAHEIAHTLFFDTSSLPPRKSARWFSHTWSEEGVCSEIGRQILVPTFMLKDKLEQANGSRFGIEAMTALAHDFDVSLDLIAWRLQDENSFDAVYVFLRLDSLNTLAPQLPMLSSGKLRVKGICSFLIRHDQLKHAALEASERGACSTRMIHPHAGVLEVACKRINVDPLRVLVLATPHDQDCISSIGVMHQV